MIYAVGGGAAFFRDREFTYVCETLGHGVQMYLFEFYLSILICIAASRVTCYSLVSVSGRSRRCYSCTISSVLHSRKLSLCGSPNPCVTTCRLPTIVMWGRDGAIDQ